ncbi:MAG: hypothetical protein HGA36_00680 [Candidatus Moranbacteria bacterium]|nr:hypothetical protein [Candidatus Moranbacteria bacterium]
MQTKKQNLIKFGATIVVFCAVFAAASATRAGIGSSVTGWLWGGSDDGAGNSSGVGWISMNDTNLGTGATYGVNVPLTDGDLVGSGWSENLGYLAFDNSGGYLNGCPDGNCIAKRVGSSLQGWARFVEIAQASAVGNSGGWLGWIKLSGVDQGGSAYGVTIESDGKLNGSAWSDELGWIKFQGVTTGATPAAYGAVMPALPNVALTAIPGIINVDTNPNWSTSGVPIVLTWSGVTNATTCTKSWDVANPIPAANGTETVSQNTQLVTYSITCTGPGGSKTATAMPVYSACYAKECAVGKCVPSGTPTPAMSSATCTPLNTCSIDNDCKAREVTDWKEVAP